jgi:hypothetical protein
MMNATQRAKRIADSFDVKAHIKNADISYRGGTLKVDVSELFPNVSNPVMGAYQNYLGGGIAGRIVGAAMFTPDELKTKTEKALFNTMLDRMVDAFFDINNGGGDDYMQNLPVSAY